MKLGKITKKIIKIQIPSVILSLLLLFFTNGTLWMILVIIIWFNILITPIVLFFDYCFRKVKDKENRSKTRIPQWKKTVVNALLSYSLASLVIIILVLSMVSFPMIFSPVLEWKAELSKEELQNEINELIKDCSNNEEKTITILKWFDRYSGNTYNIWGHPAFGSIVFGDGDPHYCIFCIRIFEREPPLWVYVSRCGACEEHSVFFREMADMAGLKIRSVICPGIDHLWAEVNIEGEWIIVEPANVVLRNNKTGYNLTAESFEKSHASRTKNISYVYAEYSNGTIEDITYRYSGNLSTVSISVVDENLNPVSHAKVTVFSNNRFIRRDIGLSFETDNNGKYLLKIGGGNITFETIKDNDIYLYNESTHIFADGEYYDITIVLKKDWTKDMKFIAYLSITIIILLILISLFIYTFIKERKN